MTVAGLLDELTYKKLEQVTRLIDKKDYTKALSRLDRLKKESGDRAYVKAVIQQTYGYVYDAQGKYMDAIKAYELSLDSQELPKGISQGIRINLASLYYSVGKITKAINMFDNWLSKENKPSPQALVFGGSLYAENQNYSKAVFLINKAIKLSTKPEESWFKRISAIYLKMHDYKNASKTLEYLITINPDNALYWKLLSASYYYSGDLEKCLSVMLVAYKKGLLKSEKEILDLSRLAASENIPYQAAQIMEAGLKNGVVSNNENNIELLGKIYLQAGEQGKAIQYFSKSAEITNKVDDYIKLLNLYYSNHQWNKALKVINSHLSNEQQSKGNILIIKGISYYEAGDYVASRAAFKRATTIKGNENIAKGWISYLELLSSK